MNATTGIGIGFHQGKVLMRLAKHYADLQAVTLEVVQNAIDAKATRIDVNINLQKRTLMISDNGVGASKEKIATALNSVGETLKKEKGMYGQFGIGLISPLSILGEFTYISCPEARVSSYTVYHFETEKIAKQKEVFIPEEPRPDLFYDPSGKIWWRTQLQGRSLTRDRRKSEVSLQGLANSTALKYGETIREHHIQVDLTITDAKGRTERTTVQVSEFTGSALECFTVRRTECGEVKIALFVARLARAGRKGEIAFGTIDNPSRISGHQFVDCARSLLETETATAILSGLFEGTVLCEKAVLHAGRTRFEDNDALFALCEALEEWYRRVGKKIIAEIESVDADNRFQRIGITVMPYAELLLQQKEFQAVAGRITVGTVGTGHAKVARRLVIGADFGVSISADGEPFGQRSSGDENGDGGKLGPTEENPVHSPGIVYGKRGRCRTEVKGNSTGLRFEYVEMEEFRTPFIFTPETGMLTFNVRFPSWGVCQQSDRYLQQYQIAVITTALTLETYRDQGGTIPSDLERYAHESVIHHAFAILNGEAMIGKAGK